MSKPDNHIDELVVILKKFAIYLTDVEDKSPIETMQEDREMLEKTISQIENFYRNKIPKDNTSMKGYATASLDELVGYSKCIDDITAQFDSKE